jgi:hypothetical protein
LKFWIRGVIDDNGRGRERLGVVPVLDGAV